MFENVRGKWLEKIGVLNVGLKKVWVLESRQIGYSQVVLKYSTYKFTA